VARQVMPFVLMMLVVLVLVTYVPAFSLALIR
jgi:TRAP-type C4-dicarboxylate transport system permease large subunit